MSDEFDLSAYLQRIGYSGAHAPTLDTLQAIHALHPAAVPFENLDPLLGRPVALDLASLQAKIVGQRRGGYCFEHNTLLAAALQALGYTVTPLAARVRWMVPPDRPEGARGHMLLRVDLDDGPYLADVGFGGLLLAAPVRMQRDVEQQTPSVAVRLVGTEHVLTLQAALPAGWQDVYRFTLDPQLPVDYVVANWYTSTHPRSLFTSNLLMQRLTPECRYTLFNTRLTSRDSTGVLTERTVADPEDLAHTLDVDFGITAPAAPAVIWERLPKS